MSMSVSFPEDSINKKILWDKWQKIFVGMMIKKLIRRLFKRYAPLLRK